MNSIGSIWRKWDLHVHTPASFHWRGKKLRDQNAEEKDDTWRGIVQRMNELDIDAFCIMDYWTFEGYLGLREYLQRNPAATKKRIFPGIELRMEAPTAFRLNTHVLFDDATSGEKLTTFLNRLGVAPDGRPPTRERLIELARSYDDGKLRVHGFSQADKLDDEKMHELGLQTVVITRESLQQAMEIAGEDRCLLIQPYDTSDGLDHLDWKKHPYTDTTLMRWADVFETRDQVSVDLFLGRGLPAKPNVGREFIDNLGGYPKPVVSGSDAHTVANYGVYPSDRITWLKAQPTFAGLQQLRYEPERRCFIGLNPPSRDHVAQNPTKYMASLRLTKVPGLLPNEHWFDGFSLDLNPGLVAIIGNKGSGKSAVADILALVGNTHCGQMEFLTDQRFRKGENKAQAFQAELKWADGSPVTVTLDQDPDLNQPERVRYLPQQFIETLCNEIAEDDETNFAKELRKVIFSHIPEEQRLGKASLDELLTYSVDAHRQAIALHQLKLRTTNMEIVEVERELGPESLKNYRSLLSLKQAEVEAHEKTRPAVQPAPVDDPTDPKAKAAAEALASANTKAREAEAAAESVRVERRELVARQARLRRLQGHLDNYAAAHDTFVKANESEFTVAGFPLGDVIRLQIERGRIDDGVDAGNARLAEIAVLLNGAGGTKGLEAVAKESQTSADALLSDLAAPAKLYQSYLAEVSKWEARKKELIGSSDAPDTVEFLKARIQRIENELPAKLLDLQQQRMRVVVDIHSDLAKIREAFRKLYKPVEDIAAETKFGGESLQLNFDAFLSPSRFDDGFLEYIHRGRVGNFYGEDEGGKKARSLVEKADFKSAEGTAAFLEELTDALTKVDREGGQEIISIVSQLKSGKKLLDFYDFIYGLQYLEPRYMLKLGDKDIGQLSPGEKGALLLVFYLLLDRELIPIIIDQPEQNLDNESVVRMLVDCIRQAAARRQVIIVTHNPNLAVVCDADQIVHVEIDKADGNRISMSAGAIEDTAINQATVNVLEGTYLAFNNRRIKYHEPRNPATGLRIPYMGKVR